jgi:hypothetical protein
MLNSYSHEEIKPSAELVSAVEMIVIVCVGATTVDKFSKKSTASNEPEENA